MEEKVKGGSSDERKGKKLKELRNKRMMTRFLVAKIYPPVNIHFSTGSRRYLLDLAVDKEKGLAWGD